MKKRTVIIAIVVLMCVVAGVLICSEAKRKIKYEQVMSLADVGEAEGAYTLFTQLGNYRDATAQAERLTEQDVLLPYRAAEKGDTVTFGRYEQDNNLGNGPEPMDWIVLDVVDGNMVSGIADSLNRISGTVSVLIVAFWLLGMLMTVLLFTLMMNARKREFASLRAMGASRGILSSIVVREALTVNLLGGAIGVLLTGVMLFSFNGLIGENLGAGFVLPPVPMTALLASAALGSVILAAVVSAWITVHKVNTMDASLVLKEGE